jgi:uracil-DNA glycosylase
LSLTLKALYSQVDHCTSCDLGTGRLPLLPLPGAGCESHPDVMFVAINPSPRNATIQRNWDGERLAWISIKRRKPKFWELLIRSGLFTVTSELQEKIFNQLAEPETIEQLIDALRSNKIFLTELVKCPTRGQKDLKRQMITTCSSKYLSEEIRLSSPKVICSWGKLPFATLTGCSEVLGNTISRLGGIQELYIDDLPRSTEEFGSLPCYPCYFHQQAPISDPEKVRHLERLKAILTRR